MIVTRTRPVSMYPAAINVNVIRDLLEVVNFAKVTDLHDLIIVKLAFLMQLCNENMQNSIW